MKHLHIILSLGILSNCIAFDQATKQLAKFSAPSFSVVHINQTIDCRWIENRHGVVDFTSTLPEELQMLFFGVVTIVLTLAVLEFILIAKRLPPLAVGGLSLTAGGAMSNLIDRLIHDGRVVDFIAVKPSVGHFVIFNYADVAIFAGAILLLFCVVRFSLGALPIRIS